MIMYTARRSCFGTDDVAKEARDELSSIVTLSRVQEIAEPHMRWARLGEVSESARDESDNVSTQALSPQNNKTLWLVRHVPALLTARGRRPITEPVSSGLVNCGDGCRALNASVLDTVHVCAAACCRALLHTFSGTVLVMICLFCFARLHTHHFAQSGMLCSPARNC